MNLAIAFELLDTKHNRRRFYRLRLELDTQLVIPLAAPPGWIVVVARGRIGGKPIVRRDSFATLERAIERFGQLAARRRQHGYREEGALPRGDESELPGDRAREAGRRKRARADMLEAGEGVTPDLFPELAPPQAEGDILTAPRALRAAV